MLSPSNRPILSPEVTIIPAEDPAFAKVDADIHYRIEPSAETLNELGEPDLAPHLPWRAGAVCHREISPREPAQTQAVAFQLLNIVEENAAARGRRHTEGAGGLAQE